MRIKVKWDKTEKEIELPSNSTIEEAIGELELLPDAFIATINGVPVPLTLNLGEGVKLHLIRVASGG